MQMIILEVFFGVVFEVSLGLIVQILTEITFDEHELVFVAFV